MGRSSRSSKANWARRASSEPRACWRRSTERTSRSISSGAASSSCRSLVRAVSPSGPSSARATASTLASTTSTVVANSAGGILQRDRPPGATAGAIQNLVQRRAVRFLDQSAAEILLQRLVGLGSTPSEHRVGLLGNVLDLHAGHGAIMAPQAPVRKLNPPPKARGARPAGAARPPRSPRRTACTTRPRSGTWTGRCPWAGRSSGRRCSP
jgi:hypothetical protein